MKTKDVISPVYPAYSEAGNSKMPAFIIATGVCAVEEASICDCIDSSLPQYQVSRLRLLDKNRKVAGILNAEDAFSNFMMIAIVGVLVLALWSMRDAVHLIFL